MPGDLWTGYLQAQAADVAEVEREEGKKKQRLEEQLQKLNMESLRRTIDRDAQKWEIEKTAQAQREEMLSGLRGFFGDEAIDAFELGFGPLELREFTEERYLPTKKELAGEWRIEAGLQPRAKVKTKTGKVSLGEQRLHWLGQPPSETPLKWKNDLVKKGYRPNAADKWEPVPKKAGTDDWINRALGKEGGGSVTEEDEFIKEARGRQIDWDAVAQKHPEWNLFYIKQKLGVNE